MTITFFNVGQGFCAYLIADNGNVMLFDCSQNSDTGFKPSAFLRANGCSAIEEFTITNFDQDHIADLPNLVRTIPIQVFRRNRSVSPDALRKIKLQAGPITTAMDSAIQLHSRYVDPVTNPPDFGIIKSIGFFNSYPDFKDTNNLSLVTILQYDGLGIIIPGDLETDGWLALLQRKDFRAELATINVFIASHHGRENGYCKEVFDYCQPDIFIISDKEIMHDTQKSLYGQHATGLPWDNGTTRYVLTTRSDGNIRLTKTIGQGYRITIGV